MSENPELVRTLRRQIDNLDNQIHDLLMERAELVVRIGDAKRKSNTQVVQPDREALMIRRLLARHKGPLPKEATVRIWRELVGAVSLLQTGLKVVVTVPDTGGLQYWDMAKDYFSSVLPMNKISDPLSALASVRENEATFAVLPWPEDGQSRQWWENLASEEGDRPLRIMARLPLGDRTQENKSPDELSLVVARVSFESSGDDRSFLLLDVDAGVSRGRISDKCAALSIPARSIHSILNSVGDTTRHLVEVDGYVASDDEKLTALLTALEQPEGRCICLGGYPVPPVYEDKVGKGAEERNKVQKAG